MKSGLSGLVVVVVVVLLGPVLGLGACKGDNKAFCEIVTDCESGQACTEHLCVDVLPGQPDATPAWPDATPTCAEATHQCLPVAPADWSGPTMRADIGVEDSPPACAMEEGGLVAGAGFEAKEGSCECSCGNAATFGCTRAQIDSGGGATAATCSTGSLGISDDFQMNSCVPIDEGVRTHGSSYIRTKAGVITGGSCNQGTLTQDFPAAIFAESVALCAPQPIQADCGTTAICAPIVAGFDDETCIYREGEHTCPMDSVFSERVITFLSLEDTRDCEACSCGVEIGTSCNGTFAGFDGAGCSNLDFVPESRCSLKTSWANSTHVKWFVSGVPCAPTEANPALLGEVSGVDPVTVCCTAPDA